jgi:hypothetical protein
MSNIDDVLKVISSILHDENAENKDRLKAGELLLKHHGAFEKHNVQKSSKSIVLNQVTALSDKELEEQLRNRLSTPSQKIRDKNIVDVEEIED